MLGRNAQLIQLEIGRDDQSFPDGFVFQGAMNAAFRQVGNAVPPLMANCIANIIRETLADAVLRLTPVAAELPQ